MSHQTINCAVMFADVAGSTAMYENMGDDLARDRISRSLDTLISITRRHHGKLVKTIGDEILAYFLDIDMAIFAAKAIQETMEDDRSAEMAGVSIRIGMQYGSVILEDNDVFGDTVNVAARVANLAKGRQILCTKEMASLVTNTELLSGMRAFDCLRVKGRREPLDVYLFAWESDNDITNMATVSSFTNTVHSGQVRRLKLTANNTRHTITTDTTSFTLGREKDCEMTIKGDLTSRYHAKLEYRRDKFILTDQSKNGTYILAQEGQEIFLRREEFTLFGSGFICLGKKVDHCDENLIQYYCE